MSNTYRATLKGDHLEWNEERPPALPPDRPVLVSVTLLGEAQAGAPDRERGRRMAEALRQLAASGGPRAPEDPLAWQREQRRERPLPGRED